MWGNTLAARCAQPAKWVDRSFESQQKKSILIKTDGPNIKTGGLTGYNREIALFEAVNL